MDLTLQYPYWRNVDSQEQNLILDQKREQINKYAHNIPKVKTLSFGKFRMKFGSEVSFTEGESAVFVATNTSIPVPKVFAMMRDETHNCNFIIMERIVGQPFSQIWWAMTPSEGEEFALTLQSWLKELRALEGKYYGCVSEKHYARDWFKSVNGSFKGPYYSMNEVCTNWLSLLAIRGSPVSHHHIVFGHIQRLLNGQDRPTFSHGGILPRNIIKRQDSGELVLVNWDRAGWYFPWWEYANAYLKVAPDSDVGGKGLPIWRDFIESRIFEAQYGTSEVVFFVHMKQLIEVAEQNEANTASESNNSTVSEERP
jgi:aminoglycoside phosphotransferase (APT) family kinase protein